MELIIAIAIIIMLMWAFFQAGYNHGYDDGYSQCEDVWKSLLVKHRRMGNNETNS